MSELLISSFALIQDTMQSGKNLTEKDRRLFFRGLRLRGQTANMLSSQDGKIKQILATLSAFPKYHELYVH